MSKVIVKVDAAIACKEDIKDAAVEKGALITDSTPLRLYSDEILKIKAGKDYIRDMVVSEDGKLTHINYYYYIPDGYTTMDPDLLQSFAMLDGSNANVSAIIGGKDITSANVGAFGQNTELKIIELDGPIDMTTQQLISFPKKIERISLPNATGTFNTDSFGGTSTCKTLICPNVDFPVPCLSIFRYNPLILDATSPNRSDLSGVTRIYNSAGYVPFNYLSNDLRGMTGVYQVTSWLWDAPNSNDDPYVIPDDYPMDFYMPPNVTEVGTSEYTGSQMQPFGGGTRLLPPGRTIHFGGLVSTFAGGFDTQATSFINKGGIIACPANSITDTTLTSLGVTHTTE